MPRDKLQNVGEYCIVMRHGDDLQSCPGTLADVQNRLESTPCALSTKSKPDSHGLVPGIHVLADVEPRKTWMAGTNPAMTLLVSVQASEDRAPRENYFRAASKGVTRSPDFSFSGNRITCLPGWRNCSMFLSTMPRNWACSTAFSLRSPSGPKDIGPTMVLTSFACRYFAIAFWSSDPTALTAASTSWPLA